jgi:hypothetical protein
MGGLIILFILGIWSALLYNAGFYASFAIQRKWVRQLIGAVTAIVLLTLPIIDEILGQKEFTSICQSARYFQIPAELEGKKFEVEFSITDPVLLPGWHWRPIWEQARIYTDKHSGRVVATGKAFRTGGGWLMKLMGVNPMNGQHGPLMGREFCDPTNHQDQVNRLRAMINIGV